MPRRKAYELKKIPAIRHTSYDPREFGKFSLMKAIEDDIPGYYKSTKERLKVYGFPTLVDSQIDRISTRAFSQVNSLYRRPSRSAIASLCIQRSIKVLDRHQVIDDVKLVKERLDSTDFTDSRNGEIITEFWRSFKVTKTIIGQSQIAYLEVPEKIRSQFSGLADSIAISDSSFGLLCIMLALSTQPEVHPDVQDRFAEIVSTFLVDNHYRAQYVDLMISESIEKGVAHAASK